MIIYLVGIGCVWKTTIGKMLADKIGFSFFDLDEEIEAYYNKPIERLQDEYIGMDGFREKASVVLDDLFSRDMDAVISGTPAGLKFVYLRVYKKHKENKDICSIHIKDSFKNILERLTFYDKDSNPIVKKLDDSMKKKYLKEIKADYNYFKGSYDRADFEIDINNTRLNDVPAMIINELKKFN
ncbi:MAG: shikimate kinase [Cyclobacteriaceae bacterium]